MNKKIIVERVMVKLSYNLAPIDIDPMHQELLDTIIKINDPKLLLKKLQTHYLMSKSSKDEIVHILRRAKQMGIFKKQFLIKDMEKAWRFWAKEHQITGFLFEN